jgi:hypothetical protein
MLIPLEAPGSCPMEMARVQDVSESPPHEVDREEMAPHEVEPPGVEPPHSP